MTKQPVTWVVIADGEHARIVVAKQKEASYVTLREFTSQTAHASAHELGDDRPGRTQESATTVRHAIQPRIDQHEQGKQEFAREVAKRGGKLIKEK